MRLEWTLSQNLKADSVAQVSLQPKEIDRVWIALHLVRDGPGQEATAACEACCFPTNKECRQQVHDGSHIDEDHVQKMRVILEVMVQSLYMQGQLFPRIVSCLFVMMEREGSKCFPKPVFASCKCLVCGLHLHTVAIGDIWDVNILTKPLQFVGIWKSGFDHGLISVKIRGCWMIPRLKIRGWQLRWRRSRSLAGAQVCLRGVLNTWRFCHHLKMLIRMNIPLLVCSRSTGFDSNVTFARARPEVLLDGW